MLELELKRVNAGMFFVQALACFFQLFFWDIGFALKPFIVVTSITLPLTLVLNGYKKTPLLYERLFLLFVAVVVVRGAIAWNVVRYIRSSVALLTVVLFYVAVSQTTARLHPQVVVRVFLAAGLVFLAASLLLYALLPEVGAIVDRHSLRLRGTTIDPNIFITFALPVLILAIAALMRGRLTALVIIALALVSMILTMSRGGLVAVMGVGGIATVKAAVAGRKKLLLLWLVAFLVVALWVAEPVLTPLVERIWDRPGLYDGSGRTTIWMNGLALFKAHPLWGIGIDNFRSYHDLLFRHEHYMHNTYLEVLVETGLVGFTLWSGSLVVFALHVSKQKQARWVKLSVYGQLIAIVFLSGLTQESIYILAGMYKGMSMYLEGYV